MNRLIHLPTAVDYFAERARSAAERYFDLRAQDCPRRSDVRTQEQILRREIRLRDRCQFLACADRKQRKC